MAGAATDAELMVRAREGDTAAFTTLIERHRGWLRQLLYHLSWSREEAEDGVQEVFLRLWQARRNWEPRAALRTYLYTLARNYWLNRSTRGRSPRQVSSLDEAAGPFGRRHLEALPDSRPTPEAQVIRNLEVSRLRRLIDGLPEKQRVVFIMNEYLDLRYAVIAETLGIPEGTVKSRMFQAVQTLREQLGREGGAEQ